MEALNVIFLMKIKNFFTIIRKHSTQKNIKGSIKTVLNPFFAHYLYQFRQAPTMTHPLPQEVISRPSGTDLRFWQPLSLQQ